MRIRAPRILLPALMVLATPALAQRGDPFDEPAGPRRFDLSAGVGLFMSTAWSENVFLESFSATGGVSRQTLLRGFSAPPSFGGTVAVTYWEGRHGFRVYGGFTEGCVTTGNDCDDFDDGFEPNFPRTSDMNVYTYGVQGIVGLVEWSEDQWWRPYLIVGGGGITYDIEEDIGLLLPGPIATTDPGVVNGVETIVILDDPGTFLFSSDQVGIESKFTLNLGVGFDLRARIGESGIGFRFEASDHISRTPLSLTVTRIDGDSFDGLCCRSPDEFEQIEINPRTVHNWRASVGMFLEFGGDGSAER